MKKFKRQIQVFQSDCTIISNLEVNITNSISKLEKDLKILLQFTEEYIDWKESYSPIIKSEVYQKEKNSVMEEMENAVLSCNVGPMAAVAGALADRMKNEMLKNPETKIAVVENGGEISIRSSEEIIVALIVLSSSLKSQIGFRYPGDNSDLGVATSSATFGHAESLGDADAVVVFAPNAALADAAATRICNEVRGPSSREAILNGISAYRAIPTLYGVFIVKDDLTISEGEIPEFVKISDPNNELIQKYT